MRGSGPTLGTICILALGLPLVVFQTDAADLGPGRRSSDRACRLNLRLLETGPSSVERSYAAMALKSCPSSSELRQGLRRAILLDDQYVRDSALRSLEEHLDASLADTLLSLYRGGFRSDEEEELVYRYLSKVVGPNLRSDLSVSVFRRGLGATENPDDRQAVEPSMGGHGLDRARYERERRITMYSLLGLGRLQALDEWPKMSEFLLGADSDLIVHALVGGTSLIFPDFQEHDVVRDTTFLLWRPEAEVQAAAIRFMDHLSGITATERLIVLFVVGTPSKSSLHPTNADLLTTILRRRLALRPDLRPGVTMGAARLFSGPLERSELLAVLEKHSVVYEAERTTMDYTLLPRRYRRGPTGPWLRVGLSDGRRGWIHASEVRFLNLQAAK